MNRLPRLFSPVRCIIWSIQHAGSSDVWKLECQVYACCFLNLGDSLYKWMESSVHHGIYKCGRIWNAVQKVNKENAIILPINRAYRKQ